MSRQPPPTGEAATWKGLVVIGSAVLLGLAVMASFGEPSSTASVSSPGKDTSRETNTTTTTTLPASTTTSVPLREPKDVRVIVANGTTTSGASKEVIDALKPACYAVQVALDATAKVKAEKRTTTTVYSTPGFEREAAQITTKLGLQTTANAALPPEPPIPTRGVPTYNVLVLLGQDLVDTPPQPLPPCEGGTGSSTTSTSAATSGGTTRRATTTTRRTSTTAKATTTTRSQTSTTRLTTTTT